MAEQYEKFKQKAFSALRGLARECPPFEDAEMLVGSSEAKASLFQQDSYKSIDVEWIEAIEKALPALDIIIRNPTVAIENVDEILPVELSRHITNESIKHLAQHTNLILDVKKNGDVVPQKILNVYHDETLLTYENKFVNTLLARLFGFVDKRYRALQNSCGIERTYKFDYQTEFEHLLEGDEGKNSAKIHLNIELTSPLDDQAEQSLDIKDKYLQAVERIKRINMALISYRSSAFSRALGRNYIRPPVVRTNAILKNKNFKECLTLWEYIESFDKAGYTVRASAVAEKPSSQYIGDLCASVALQYTDFYYGVAEREDKRFLSDKHLFEVEPDFDTEFMEEELEDYQVFDSEYKKTVPVSRLMNNRKKLSVDEKRIHRALAVALKADEILNAEMKAAEAEMRRLERQRRLEEEERRRAEEAERARLAALLTQMPIAVRYRRSFLSRYIQSGENLQEYYARLKNELLSYEGLKSHISWKADRFSKGRTTLARMDVRGKRLYLYLALDPAAYEGSKYRFTDVSDKKADTPMLLKIKGKLGILHAMQLVERLAEKYALTATEREDLSYAAPYEDDQALIGKGLIKLVFPKGVKMEDGQVLTKENLRDLFEGRAKKQEDIVPLIEEEPPTPIAVRYRRSFLSRYIQSSEDLQDYYGRLKNKLLSYKKVKSKISWKADRFSKGRRTLARIDVRGKRIYLYLALDPASYEGSKYRFTDVSDKKTDTPMLLKIKGKLGILHALQLVERLTEEYRLMATEREDISYATPYETDDALIEKGLIRVVYPKGTHKEEGQVLTRANLRLLFEGLRETPEKESVEESVPTPEGDTGASNEEVARTVVEETEPVPFVEGTGQDREETEPLPVEEEINVPLAEAIPEAEKEALLVEETPHYEEISPTAQSFAPVVYEENAGGRYAFIRDTLLFNGAILTQTEEGEGYFLNGKPLAILRLKGNKLYLYLAVSPSVAAEEQCSFTNVAKKLPDTPILIKIKREKEMKEALTLLGVATSK